MKILLTLLLVFYTAVGSAGCSSYVIGFRGAGGAFDQAAFDRYAERNAACSLVYNSEEIVAAVNFINQTKGSYQLYGFSAGASAIVQVLKKVKRMPNFVLTIGAWYTTDVDFGDYEINFDNFFDDSGRQQQSPGIHVYNVSHGKMQEYVNDFYE
jgi:hypothetical protein